jgi:hypothetical protein
MLGVILVTLITLISVLLFISAISPFVGAYLISCAIVELMLTLMDVKVSSRILRSPLRLLSQMSSA